MGGIDTLIEGPVIEALGWALLHFVWQGALVGVLAAVALRILRRSAADVRYVIAAVALSLMAALPLATGIQAYRAAQSEVPERSGYADGVATVRQAFEDVAPAGIQAGVPVPSPNGTWPALERWMPLVVLGWMLGVGILAVRLAGGWMWMQRMKSHGAVPADPGLQAVVRRLSRRLHITRSIALLRSPGVDVPTVIGWLKPTVLLPMSAVAGLSPLQMEAILAHELAHIRRHDYFVNLLQTLLETLLFYHPAVWWVSKQIRTERENCCDDLAVSLCGDPVIYATALADLEELRGPASRLVLAASGGALLERVRRLLTGPTRHAGRGPAWLAATAAALLLVVLGGLVGRHSLSADARSIDAPPVGTTVQDSAPPAASVTAPAEGVVTIEAEQAPPEPPSPPAPPSPPEGSTRVEGTDQKSSGNFVWSNDGEKISIKYEGAFEVDDRDSGIKSVSPGGFLHIADGEGRRVEFTADRAGALSIRYSVNNRERAFEPEGRQWLGSVLPRFIRQSGFGARSRVARLLANGGVPSVLSEISKIESSYAKKLYFTELMKQTPVDGATAQRILEQAGREVQSDYELASLLISAMDKLLVNGPTQGAFFTAARTLQSDYEMRRVFSAALKRATLTDALTADLLDGARELDSDYEAASLLVDLLRLHGIEPNRPQFFAAVHTLGSSYEKSRVLQEVLRRSDVSGETVLAALNAAATIGSSYETSRVLQAAARSHEISGPARDIYMKIADRLGGYEGTQVLAALARNERRK